jgi:hypothetical protein
VNKKENHESYGKNEKNGRESSDKSHVSHNSHLTKPIILSPRGDYKTLLSYQKAEVIL